jgi:glutamine amidotransferase
MCRWIAYRGAPAFLEEFISKPCQSLVVQSRRCLQGKEEVNADGFGVGWYGERERPGLFRDIRPAWSDDNLLSLAHQIRSHLFLAHVRASTGGATMRSNCHPFSAGNMLFMHNGQIPGWERLRRRIENAVPEPLYAHRGGTTDSEALFLLLLAHGLGADPGRALARVLDLLETELIQAGVDAPLKVTAAWSDGRALHAVRYASVGTPPSLYTRRDPETGATLVVSEPLDLDTAGWTPVPAQSLVSVDDAGVRIETLRRVAVLA